MAISFEGSKEETYSLFREKCGELLRAFLSEKEKKVCSLCSDSCTEIEKTNKALKVLVTEMVFEAVKGWHDKKDIFLCVLMPYLSTLSFFESYAQGKTAKRLLKEMEKGYDRLLAIIRSSE